MTTPYRLHYAPDNASLCVRLVLEHLAIPYETTLVDRRANAQRNPDYLALNPNGLIPVLETPEGAMFETAAILLWLADRHGGLAPAPDSPERGDFLKWLFWLSNTLHPALRMLFYPEKYAVHAADLRETTKTRICGLLDLLDQGPAMHPGTLLSCYAAPMLRWLALYPLGDTAWFDLRRWPRLHTLAVAMDSLPATCAAQTAEGLGPTPFSAPSLPTPPEGSAL